jgi:hypothetical protein
VRVCDLLKISRCNLTCKQARDFLFFLCMCKCNAMIQYGMIAAKAYHISASSRRRHRRSDDFALPRAKQNTQRRGAVGTGQERKEHTTSCPLILCYSPFYSFDYTLGRVDTMPPVQDGNGAESQMHTNKQHLPKSRKGLVGASDCFEMHYL